MPLPSLASITAMLKGDDTEDKSAAPQAQATEPEAGKPESDKSAAAPSAEQAKTETAETAEAAKKPESPPISPQTFEESIRAQGARAAFEMLSEDAKLALAKEFQPGLYRVISRKESERKRAEQASEDVERRISTRLDERLDAVLTSGMNDEERQAYFERKDLDEFRAQKKASADKAPQPTPEQVAIAQENERRWIEMWRMVTEAGLPADEYDPRVRSLDWALDERDFEQAKTRLRSSLEKLNAAPAGRAPAAAATPPTAGQADLVERALERVDELLHKRLREAGILSADTGRPGSGGGPPPRPHTIEGARDAVRKQLEADLRSP